MAISEQKVIHRLQDEMVRRAELLVLHLNLEMNKREIEKGRTQASKALEVAQSAGSLPVFINWLRYQAGRRGVSADFWTKKSGSRSLVKGMSEELGWLRNQVRAEMADASKETQDRVTMRAVVRFLGYFRRALIGAALLKEIVV